MAKRRIADSVAGFAELTAMLAEAGDGEDAPVPVAIETSRGLLVAALLAAGRPVYPINPMAVARYRERSSLLARVRRHVTINVHRSMVSSLAVDWLLARPSLPPAVR